MTKKRKKKNKGRKARKSVQPKQLPGLGAKQLENGKFNEAIKTYRQLLKEDTDECWLVFLVQAYQGRIKQLTAKGMAKEALVIYHNMVGSCHAEDHLLHFILLLKTGHDEQAVDIFPILKKSLSKPERQIVEELFAALLLSGKDKALKYLPDDSLLKNHYQYANMALKSYCQGDDIEAEKHLQEITFRSPFKNFRLALKGMLLYAKNRQEAGIFFDKIPDSSAFMQLVIPYQQLSCAADETVNLSRLEQQVVQTLEGIDKSTGKFLDGIIARQNEPVRLYSFLVGQKRFLSRGKMRNICYRLLPHAVEKYADFSRRFGVLDDFHYEQTLALTSEVLRQYWEAAQDWQDALAVLEKSNDPRDNLKKALILCHCAALLERDDGTYNFKEIIKLLEKSLEYDPHDRSGWFMLIDRMGNSNLNQQYKLVNRMLAEFPEDVEVLLKGVEAAFARGAFKKASGLAAKLLKIDPINSKARLLLINAHLDHGRKLAGQGKFKLAIKECQSAAGYERSGLAHGEIEICHGLLLMLAGEKDKGFALHDEGVAKAAHLINGRFLACLEARLLQHPKKWLKIFDKNLRTACKSQFDTAVFMDFMAKLQCCNGKKHLAVQEFRRIITLWLAKGLKLNFSRDEYLTFCAIFQQKCYFDLLEKYGKMADKLWPDTPLFVYYYFCGKSEDGAKRLPMNQIYRLADMGQVAMDQHDPKTAMVISELVQKIIPEIQSGLSSLGKMPDMGFDEFIDLLESGEIDKDDLAALVENPEFFSGLFDEPDDFWNEEDDEIF